MENNNFVFNDGGRSRYFKGTAGDCVTRAISIVTEKDYKEVYDELFEIARQKSKNKPSPRNGVNKKVYDSYMKSLGYSWIPTMHIGQGCTTHLIKEELPSGRIIARLSKHLVAVIDGIIHDTYDCSRGGDRCVYGYYIKK